MESQETHKAEKHLRRAQELLGFGVPSNSCKSCGPKGCNAGCVKFIKNLNRKQLENFMDDSRQNEQSRKIAAQCYTKKADRRRLEMFIQDKTKHMLARKILVGYVRDNHKKFPDLSAETYKCMLDLTIN